MLTAFAPRKNYITLDIMSGCLHIRRLSEVHVPTLTKLIVASVKHVRKTYPA